MYLYRITNLINNKKYIGITNDYKRRWSNHKCCKDPSMAIAKAIKKYGAENFKFELVLENLSIEEACQKEIEYIKEEKTLVPNGYNISKGGNLGSSNPKYGADNANANLTFEEAKYIKDHRNIPEYVLYEEFVDKISYSAFKNIYHDKTYKNIEPTVEMYPYNLEFSNQFTSGNKLTYNEVVNLRKQYSQGIPWREAYRNYSNIITNEWSFWKIYTGATYKLVMPEVFNEENKKKHKVDHSGENNGRSKLTKEDVILIREKHQQGVSNKEIYNLFPNITPTSIRNVINYKTWKTI